MDTTTSHTNSADVEAIKQVVATLQHSQQHELPDEFAGLFRHDAIRLGPARRVVKRTLSVAV